MTEERDLNHKIIGLVPLVKHHVSAAFRETDSCLAHNHFSILMRLNHRSYTAGELADKYGVSPPTMSKTVDVLVKRGWIERGRAPEDRRVIHLKLSEGGTTALKRFKRAIHRRVDDLIAPLSPQELQKLEEGLDILYDTFERTAH